MSILCYIQHMGVDTTLYINSDMVSSSFFIPQVDTLKNALNMLITFLHKPWRLYTNGYDTGVARIIVVVMFITYN